MERDYRCIEWCMKNGVVINRKIFDTSNILTLSDIIRPILRFWNSVKAKQFQESTYRSINSRNESTQF